MRSSKSRSRSKQNRPRPVGNIINRVFESSGPEGKVRGTPQQIIEKYLVLARDAQLSNDRVAAENFLQHAEHYTRMLGEAQREMAAEQEARRQQFTPQGQERGGPERGGDRGPERSAHGSERSSQRPVREDDGEDAGSGLMPALGFAEDDDSGLVDLPEARRTPEGEADETKVEGAAPETNAPKLAAEAGRAPRRRSAPVESAAGEGEEGADTPARRGRGRGPRRPRSGAAEGTGSEADGTAAAE